MEHERFAHPIWDLDPRPAAEPTYDDYERLFLAAYRATFRLHAGPSRVRPYLTRYLRFYVVAPWVRVYARERPGNPLAEELAGAPLDPLLDWRHLARRFEAAVPLLYPRRVVVLPGQVTLAA